MISLILRKFRSYKALAKSLGPLRAIVYVVQRYRMNRVTDKRPFKLYSRNAQYPLFCRANTSDLNVFDQIFQAREYRCLDDALDQTSAGLIVDCGANVGYATAYFLSRFPKATAVAIEPDEGNISIIKKNVSQFHNRCQIIRAGVWSHETGLVFNEVPFRDGREWALRVREARADETPLMRAVDINSILKASGFDRIFLLKVDIEGAESVVFGPESSSWIKKVDNIVIELHGDDCKKVFMSAIAAENFAISECDELTVCLRSRQPK